jgi:hypothetical protein
MGTMKLNASQIATLFAAKQSPLVRCDDGYWRMVNINLPAYNNDDVRILKTFCLVEMIPIGAIITEAGIKHCDHISRQP